SNTSTDKSNDAVKPLTDNHPFFSHFFKWSQIDEILRTLGVTWQPFGGAGYLVILLIFIIALILAMLLILLPVAFLRKKHTRLPGFYIPLFFSLIGLAFMLVEIPLIQQFILYLDQPAYAFAAVLFTILLFSGLGSRFGSRWLPLSRAIIILTGLLIFYLFALSPILHTSLGYPLIARLVITLLLIAPIGFLMGIPFPAGLIWMRTIANDEDNPGNKALIPWVWAVNGASSVVASILASLLTLSFGFIQTTAVGMCFYLLAGIIVHSKKYDTLSG
ncbi:MAG: hypothetical protein ACK2TV_00040, partial [Anaerolineales bacterium]